MSPRKQKNERRKREKQHKRRLQLKQGAAEVPSATRIVRVESGGREKMSEVLEDFVAPWMELADTEDGYRKLITLGVLAWNAALLPDGKQEAMIDQVLREGMPRISPAERTTVRALIQEMIDRKSAHFASNRRAIISFDLRDTGSSYHLSVISTLDQPPVP
jgi:hypothetical protein